MMLKTRKKKSITSRNYTVTYYQTLEEAPWLLRLDKTYKMTKIFKNFEKFRPRVVSLTSRAVRTQK